MTRFKVINTVYPPYLATFRPFLIQWDREGGHVIYSIRSYSLISKWISLKLIHLLDYQILYYKFHISIDYSFSSIITSPYLYIDREKIHLNLLYCFTEYRFSAKISRKINNVTNFSSPLSHPHSIFNICICVLFVTMLCVMMVFLWTNISYLWSLVKSGHNNHLYYSYIFNYPK